MHLQKPHMNEWMYRFFHNKELDELYLSVAIKSFAEAFIAIFVPIYLLNLGLSISNIAAYYLIYFITVAILMPFCMILNSKFGLKKVMTFGTVVLVIYYVLLNYMNGTIPFEIIAIVYGISSALYFSSFNVVFSRCADKDHEASEISFITIITIVSGAAGPVLGATFISTISFHFLFFLVSVLLLLSVIPLFFSEDKKIARPNLSYKKIIKSDTKGKGIAYQSNGIIAVVLGIFWPIFMYISLGNYLLLGSIISLTWIIIIFYLFIIGRLTDNHKISMLKTGTVLHSFSWITRLLFISPIGILINNIYSSLSAITMDLAFSKMIYSKAKKSSNVANYFLFREYNLTIGKVIILSIGIILNSIVPLFIISFFVTYLHLFALRK